MPQSSSGAIPFFTTDPQAQQNYLDVQRRMALAAALQEQGMKPLDTNNRTVGGVGYRISPMEGIAKLMQAYSGGRMQDQAIKDQAQMQADYLQRLTGMMGGDQGQGQAQNDVPPDNSALATALSQGAAAGSVGPTNDNAQRLAAALQGQDGTSAGPSAPTLSPDDLQDKRDKAGLTSNAPMRVPSNVGAPTQTPAPVSMNAGTAGSARGPVQSPLNPTGIPPQIAAQLYMLNPEEYLKTVAGQSGPTDFQKIALASGLRPGSPEYQQFMRANVDKQNYVAPVPIRPGGGVMDRSGNITTLPASAPPGFQMTRKQDGTWAYVPVQNGPQAVTDSAAAQARGGAQLDSSVVFNQDTGEYEFSNRARDADRGAPQYAPGASAAPGGAPGSVPGVSTPGAITNPGNLRQPGQSTGFAQYPTPEAGLAAIDQNLRAYGAKGVNTVSAIISRWAPPSENNTAAYIKDVADRIGVKPDQPLDMNSPLVRHALSTGIMLHEQGPGKVFGLQGGNTGNVVPKPAPGLVEAQTTLANNNAQMLTNTVKQASDSATRVNVLDNILNLSRSGVQTGPSADFMNKVKGYAASLPGADLVAPKWTADVAGYQEMQKFMMQNAQRSWQAAGGTGTDAQLDAFLKSNPNTAMMPQAVQAVTEWTKAGELALQARANAMQNYANGSPQNLARLDRFEQTWRQSFDPVLYQLKTMDPQRATAYTENLQRTNPRAYQALMQKASNLRQMGAY